MRFPRLSLSASTYLSAADENSGYLGWYTGSTGKYLPELPRSLRPLSSV